MIRLRIDTHHRAQRLSLYPGGCSPAAATKTNLRSWNPKGHPRRLSLATTMIM
jgi:hypothetical protein